MRSKIKRAPGRASLGDGTLRQKIAAALPFALTASQNTAMAEINADLGAPTRMLRLLQGDVGSGKTLVALFAMAAVVEAGRQAALMAPTEILARQHHQTLAKFAEAAGLRLALLTGRDKGAGRDKILGRLAEGSIDIVVGTHALFQESVVFHDLGLAVVDEQHRFGVHQRLALGDKSEAADILVMTATPIPRTLVLTYFGDMDVSNLREKPAGRQPIETRALPLERLDELIARLTRALADGARAFWVCPLVEESEALDVAAAQERFAQLQANFRRQGWACSRQDEKPRQGCGDGSFRQRLNPDSCRDNGHRGRCRCSASDDHGDRACRAVRACAIASIARTRRARRRQVVVSPAL